MSQFFVPQNVRKFRAHHCRSCGRDGMDSFPEFISGYLCSIFNSGNAITGFAVPGFNKVIIFVATVSFFPMSAPSTVNMGTEERFSSFRVR